MTPTLSVSFDSATTGHVLWQGLGRADHLTLALGWRLVGKAEEAGRVVAVAGCRVADAAGERGFRIILPDDMRPFSGRLLSRLWAVGARLQETAVEALMLVPGTSRDERVRVPAESNPFRSERVRALPFRFTQGDGWDTFLARLQAHDWRGAVVGQDGAGKTALLAQLAPRLEARGFRPVSFRVARGRSMAQMRALHDLLLGLGGRDFLLLDSAGNLMPGESLLIRRRLKGVGGCLITAHRPSFLPTLLAPCTDPRLLRDLLAELCPDAPADLEAVAQTLFQHRAGNIRDVLADLYEWWADHGPSDPSFDALETRLDPE